MGEKKTGWRALLNSPIVYDKIQLAMSRDGQKRLWDKYCSGVVNVLDIGCGTASILSQVNLPFCYTGFDIDSEYISYAKTKFRKRKNTTFFLSEFNDYYSETLKGQSDLVSAFGLLHHLDDESAATLLSRISKTVALNGRAIFLDPCRRTGQSWLTKFFIGRDRGLYIRNAEQYIALAKQADFSKVESYVHDDLMRFPYDHHVMVCYP